MYGHPGVKRISKFYNYHSKQNKSCNKKLFYLHVSHCIHMYTLFYKNISRSICDVCVYIYTYVCVFIYHTHAHTHAYIYIYTIIYIYTFIYIHIYIYMYLIPIFIWPHPFSNLRCHPHRPKADTYAAILSVCEAASSWVSASEA